METTSEHILSTFAELRWFHFTGVAIVGALILVVNIFFKGRKHRSYTWPKKNGRVPTLEARRDDATPEQLEKIRRQLGLTEGQFEELYR